MSNTSAVSASPSTSGSAPTAASPASVSRSMISRRRPVSSRTRAMKSGPLPAMRQASVATSRTFSTLRQRSLLAQTLSASMVRAIASSLRRPVWASLSPSRTMRENASTTEKPFCDGVAISSRQLFVPRSSAPYSPPGGCSRETDLRWAECPSPAGLRRDRFMPGLMVASTSKPFGNMPRAQRKTGAAAAVPAIIALSRM